MPLNFSGVVDFKKLNKLLALSGAVLVFFLISCAFLGSFYLVLLGRMFLPFSDFAYPTRTQFESLNSPVAVKEGDKVDLEAKVSGDIPDEGLVYVKIGAASWENFVISHGETSGFAFQLPKASQSLAYYFRIGSSAERQVKVVKVP